MLARDRHFDVPDVAAEDACRLREPVDFLAAEDAEEADREDGFQRSRRSPCGFAGGLDLRQRKAGMVQKDATGIGELDAARAADQQLRADLMFQVSDPTAERWLRRM
jgi:hypothetical protein